MCAKCALCFVRDGVGTEAGIFDCKTREVEVVEVFTGGEPARTAANNEFIVVARGNGFDLRSWLGHVVFSECEWTCALFPLCKRFSTFKRVHITPLRWPYHTRSLTLPLAHLRTKKPDDNLLPTIREARIRKHALHALTQIQILSPTWIRRQQTKLPLEMRA